MFGSEILEVAIGLVFVFLIASLIASAIREMIEAVLKTRAVQLERGIRQLLDDPQGTRIAKDVFDHPLLFGLFAGTYEPTRLAPLLRRRPGQALGWIGRLVGFRSGANERTDPASLRVGLRTNLPAYVPSRNFAMALLDLVGKDGSAPGVLSLESVKANAMALPAGAVRDAVLVAVGEAGDNLDRARASLEAWYDSSMDRVSGWYKRETHWILFAIGLLLAVTLNIDSFSTASSLARDNALRQQIVARANQTFPQGDPRALTTEQLREQADGLSGVIGWATVDAKVAALRKELEKAAREQRRDAEWVRSNSPGRADFIGLGNIAGWLLTALAISLGAPFWFDVLNKFMVIRSTVKPYEKSPAEGSEDRRGGAPSAARLESGTDGAASQFPGQGNAAADGQPVPTTASIRLALDADNLQQGTLKLAVDGQEVPVPPDGFVELPLEVGRVHVLEATGKSGETDVRWRTQIEPTLADEGLALDEQLV